MLAGHRLADTWIPLAEQEYGLMGHDQCTGHSSIGPTITVFEMSRLGRLGGTPSPARPTPGGHRR
jgi:hypothetical protein